MKPKTLCVILFGALLLPVASFSAGQRMQEGLWEITTTTEMPGMKYKAPPTTVKHCYTKEDVKDSKQVVPKQEGNCKMTDLKESGNKVSWKVVCSGKQSSKSEGEMIFRGSTAYDGTMKIETGGMKMTTVMKAKRIGDCSK